MPKMKNHAGVRYGKVVGISATDKRVGTSVVWRWICDCGTEFESTGRHYICNGNAGCPECARNYQREVATKYSTTHGLSSSKEYDCWCDIKNRCLNPNSQRFEDYGGKGISIFDGWENNFEAFISHIGFMPVDGSRYSCDRIDNSRGYEPGNVRWATDSQQARNKKKKRTNTSGVTGVCFLEKMHKSGKTSTRYAVAQWYNIEGKHCTKLYSVEKYGEELAFFLACEKRDLEIMRLNLLGAGYTENHGK